MPSGEPSRKPINKVSPFCPRATAEGMAGSGSVVHDRVPNLETGEKVSMDLWCELCKNKCCIYLPEVPQTERKGLKDRRKSARRPGLRIPGLVQKTGMVHVHLTVHKHFSSMAERSTTDRKLPVRVRQMQPKRVRLQERKSTYCSGK